MTEERKEIPWDKMKGVAYVQPEPSRDINAVIVGMFLILVLLFFAYRLVQSVSGWFEFLAVIPMTIAAAGIAETYKAWQKVPREKA